MLTEYSSFKIFLKKKNLTFKATNNNVFFNLEKVNEYDFERKNNNEELSLHSTEFISDEFLNSNINENGQLTWFPIGFAKEFKKNVKQFPEIKKKRYVAWRDDDKFYGLRDACCHEGSSFQNGKNDGCLISCPYHGYTFNGTSGNLVSIPFMKNTPLLHVSNHKVIEKNGIVYLNTVEGVSDKIDENNILSIPEECQKGYRSTNLKKVFKNGALYVTCNSIDIRHISIVHNFGNKNSPEPVIINKKKKEDFHYKIIYNYKAGTNSIPKKIYGISDIVVESEFKFPYATVARVLFGNFVSTIYIQTRPVNDNYSISYVKAIRNYLVENEEKGFFFQRMYAKFINTIGDKLTENTMIQTLEEDAKIVGNLDEHEKNKFIFSTQSDSFPFLYAKMYKEFLK